MQHERFAAELRAVAQAEEVLQARLHPRRPVGLVVHLQPPALRERHLLRREPLEQGELLRREQRAQRLQQPDLAQLGEARLALARGAQRLLARARLERGERGRRAAPRTPRAARSARAPPARRTPTGRARARSGRAARSPRARSQRARGSRRARAPRSAARARHRRARCARSRRARRDRRRARGRARAASAARSRSRGARPRLPLRSLASSTTTHSASRTTLASDCCAAPPRANTEIGLAGRAAPRHAIAEAREQRHQQRVVLGLQGLGRGRARVARSGTRGALEALARPAHRVTPRPRRAPSARRLPGSKPESCARSNASTRCSRSDGPLSRSCAPLAELRARGERDVALGEQRREQAAAVRDAARSGLEQHAREPRVQRQTAASARRARSARRSRTAPRAAGTARSPRGSASAGGACSQSSSASSRSPPRLAIAATASRVSHRSSRAISGRSCAGQPSCSCFVYSRRQRPSRTRPARPARCVAEARLMFAVFRVGSPLHGEWPARAHEAAVDHRGDPVDRERALGDVGRQDQLALGAARERAVLLLRRQVAVQQHEREVRPAGRAARARRARGGSRPRRAGTPARRRRALRARAAARRPRRAARAAARRACRRTRSPPRRCGPAR